MSWTTGPGISTVLQEKGLPAEEISVYNHMAIYLRWCMEHDLMGVDFLERIQRSGPAGSKSDLCRCASCGRLSGMSFGRTVCSR